MICCGINNSVDKTGYETFYQFIFGKLKSPHKAESGTGANEFSNWSKEEDEELGGR